MLLINALQHSSQLKTLAKFTTVVVIKKNSVSNKLFRPRLPIEEKYKGIDSFAISTFWKERMCHQMVGGTPVKDSMEIYLWDGQATVSLSTNRHSRMSLAGIHRFFSGCPIETFGHDIKWVSDRLMEGVTPASPKGVEVVWICCHQMVGDSPNKEKPPRSPRGVTNHLVTPQTKKNLRRF